MKSRNSIVSLILLVSFVALVAAVTIATRSSEPAAAGTERARLTGTYAAQTGDAAEAAYQELTGKLRELEAKARSTRSSQERMDILKQIDVLLSEFIDEYHGTPQAAEMSFDAGLVKFSLQKPKQAIRYLEGFLSGALDPERDKQAYAHFYLAEAYKQVGEIDDGEAEYRILLNSFGDVDRRMTGMVEQNMSMLESERRLKVGSPPIDFEVTGMNGEKLSPDQYKGKVLLLDFWATWCAPCRQEMPNVIKVYNKYNEKGFEIVGISLDKSRNDLERYIEKYDLEWPQYYDGKFWQNKVATLYGVKAIPATYLIDKRGNIRYKSLRGHQLEVAVKELLAE